MKLQLTILVLLLSIWQSLYSQPGSSLQISEKYWVDEAKIKVNNKDYQRAIEDCNRAIALDANFVRAYNWRGIIKFILGRYAEAIADYNQAIALDP